VTFTVTLDQCSILSILVQRETVTNQGHFLRQLGDVWRSTDGYPISARAFLTVGSRKELGSLLSRRAPNHSQKQLLRRFDPYRFFLTETQLHLYYPAGTLNASDREILTISLPLSPGPVQFL
jgi:hypothetical protein